MIAFSLLFIQSQACITSMSSLESSSWLLRAAGTSTTNTDQKYGFWFCVVSDAVKLLIIARRGSQRVGSFSQGLHI